jgi:hypothetical protein
MAKMTSVVPLGNFMDKSESQSTGRRAASLSGNGILALYPNAHPVGETIAKSPCSDTNVNVPDPSSMCAMRPVVRDIIPDMSGDPWAGGHMNVCSITMRVDSLFHLFRSKSASPNVEAMGSLIEFVLLQEGAIRSGE